MNPDNTSPKGSPTSDRERPTGSFDSRVVLVADGNPSVTDEIARMLRDRYTVRSAYDSADALASLDPDVSAALLDPDIPGLSARRVVDRVRTDDTDCQVAALADERLDVESTAFDDYLVKPVQQETLRDTVDRLCQRADYRTTLEEYYAVARQRATATEKANRDHLARRLDELEARLDETFETLDGPDAYDAALRELNTDS